MTRRLIGVRQFIEEARDEYFSLDQIFLDPDELVEITEAQDEE